MTVLRCQLQPVGSRARPEVGESRVSSPTWVGDQIVVTHAMTGDGCTGRWHDHRDRLLPGNDLGASNAPCAPPAEMIAGSQNVCEEPR
jgi:hypothetical protein